MDNVVDRELQINIHPNDYKHFELLFRHQINVFGKQIDRIRLTLDLHNSENGRYRSDNFTFKLEQIRSIISRVSNEFPFISVDEVDTSESVRKEIAKKFFCREDIPIKAWDGGPFYAYLYGLWKCRARTIIHIDSDMLFGGMSHAWISQAENILDQDPSVIFIAPFAGPPSSERLPKTGSLQDGIPVIPYGLPNAYIFRSVSTRIFVTRPQLIEERMRCLDFTRPSYVQRIKALLLGNSPQTKEFEVILSNTIQKLGLVRVDLLGNQPGLFSIHPPFRSDNFYTDLPNIIRKIEVGDIPKEQYGHYDLQDCMCDWSEARKRNKRFRRIGRQAYRLIYRIYSKLIVTEKKSGI